MYYHSRDIKYVKYGKVSPPPVEALDPDMAIAYQWLGQYCGFFPQIWLSRSKSRMTGFRNYGQKDHKKNTILFGFDIIKGFPLDYWIWCELLNVLVNSKNINEANVKICEHFESSASDPDFDDDVIYNFWRTTHNLQDLLYKYLFVKTNQVVVPSLNLKAAKLIVCRNEREKKDLRQMGFIEDRISIRKGVF